MKIESRNARSYLNHMQIIAFLSGCDEWDAEKVYLKVKRLELKANRWATQECNENVEEAEEERRSEFVYKKVKELLPVMDMSGFFYNGDPRGFSLKLKNEAVVKLRDLGMNIYTDWGSNGILAPEF